MSFLIALFSVPALAGPWMDPGNSGLRHDVQLLSDAGVIHAPLTTWPLAWEDLVRDIQAYDGNLAPAYEAARLRVLRQYRKAARIHEVKPHLRVAAAAHPRQYRTFEATPRENGEAEAGMEWTGDNFAYRLQATAAVAPDDHRPLRLDGSYLAAVWGNWSIAAGVQPRWWGPGWDGSLIMSTNARPIPSLTVRRHLSDPFESKWLHWLGPWQFLFSLGQLEGDRYVPHAMLLGMRLTFRPTQSFELGMTRTAQWGGEGRPEDLTTFKDILLGRDNVGSNGITKANEPGNQLAGFDFRWQSPLFKAPYAIYAQAIGEDEAGGWPSRYTGLFGVETWGAWGNKGASWRLHAEYADTATGGFYSSHPLYNYAYHHHIYQSGYTYYGRIIGHSLGGDGRIATLGLLVDTAANKTWELLLRRIEPERDVATSPVIHSVELSHGFTWGDQTINLRLAELRSHTPGATDFETQADAQWQWSY
ncbi:MAG: capsule assembly Wzi family protein [Gammaproteobacteria bacterium]